MEQAINAINNVIWSNALIILCLAVGIYFSFATGFLQVRYLKDMVKLLFGGGASNKGVSSFQAFALALSGRIGTGNIAGVATAIAMGGPGAVFWMWLIAFLDSASAYVEATLGQLYKEVKDGQCRAPSAATVARCCISYRKRNGVPFTKPSWERKATCCSKVTSKTGTCTDSVGIM